VEVYLDALDPDRKSALSALRKLIHKSVPKVVESIQYKMPTFSSPDGRIVCNLASQKNYMALYVCEPAILDAHSDELSYLNCGKGCIRFKSLDELPLKVVEKIVKSATR